MYFFFRIIIRLLPNNCTGFTKLDKERVLTNRSTKMATLACDWMTNSLLLSFCLIKATGRKFAKKKQCYHFKMGQRGLSNLNSTSILKVLLKQYMSPMGPQQISKRHNSYKNRLNDPKSNLFWTMPIQIHISNLISAERSQENLILTKRKNSCESRSNGIKVELDLYYVKKNVNILKDGRENRKLHF